MEQLTKEQLELHQLADECIEESLRLLLEGNLNLAKETASRARDTYEELNDYNGMAASLNRLAVIYEEMGNETMNIKCILEGLDAIREGDDRLLEAKLYNNLGSRFMRINDYSRALDCLNLAAQAHDGIVIDDENASLDRNKISDVNEFEAIMNLNFSSIYYHLDNFAQAKHHFDMVKAVSKDLEDKSQQLLISSFEGLLFWHNGEKEKAAEMVSSFMKTIEEVEYATDYLESMSYLIELLMKMKQYDTWEHLLVRLEKNLADGVSLYVKSELLKCWIEYYKTTNNTDKYHEACIKFYELSKSKYDEDCAKASDNIVLQIEMNKAKFQKKRDDQKVYFDALTGIGNRTKIIEDSKRFIAESVKNHTEITIGLIDIDFFKECNDTYGHIEGDNCLRNVASVLSRVVGEEGCVYRYGGDEFLIILPDIRKEDINAIGGKIKSALELEKIPNKKSAISPYVTVSQGYSSAYAEPGDTIETMINLADLVLYSVKRRGRNGYNYTGYKDILKL